MGRENKYSVVEPASPSASNSAGIYQDGSDYSYFIQAKFGSSEKPMYMLLDSGAGTTWVMATGCQSTACTKHNSFGPGDSETYRGDSKTFSIAYGTGKVSGELARDSISVAGMDIAMTFGAANETSDDFVHFPFDGILGLSMSKGATDNFMGVLMESKMLTARVFSVSLGRASDGVNYGQVTFGGTDPSQYTGEISYTSVSHKGGGDWSIPMDDMAYDGKPSGIKGRLAYIDTGTSYMFGPEADVAAIHKVIPGATTSDEVEYTVPCDSDLPLTVTFSGVAYKMSSKDWMSKKGDRCVSNIYGHEVVKDSWLMGDLFLKNVYAVFDADQKRIGFALKPALPDKPETTPSSGPSSTSKTDGEATPVTSPIAPGSGLNGQETPGSSEATQPSATTHAGQPWRPAREQRICVDLMRCRRYCYG